MHERLRIAHLLATPDGKPGGLERHTLELCAELARQHEVHLLADPGFAVECAPAVHFHPIHFSRSRWNPLLYREIFLSLHSARPDVIHAQAGKSASILSRLRPLFPDCTFVATQHGMQKNIRPYLAMDGVITVSSALAKRYPPELVKVVHNGLRPAVKLSHEERATLRSTLISADAQPLVIAIGRLDPIKGFDVLLHAIRDLPCTLLLVGDGPSRMALETQAADVNLAGRVRFLGWRHDVSALLQAADLCVISSHSEGFSLVMLEALQAGTPLVSTAVGALPELLPAELLATPGDAASLQRLLGAALHDLSALREKLAHAFTVASSEMTMTGMAKKTEDFYREVSCRKNQFKKNATVSNGRSRP